VTAGVEGGRAKQTNYRRAGFAVAYDHVRYQGEGDWACPAGVVRLSAVPFDEVLDYDRRCFPVPRPTFLRAWLAMPESAALGFLREGRLAGFGVAHRRVEGVQIGPRFADDLAAAEALLRGLTAGMRGWTFFLDAPDGAENPAAALLVERYELREVLRTARMYTRGRPRLHPGRVFGITSLELG